MAYIAFVITMIFQRSAYVPAFTGSRRKAVQPAGQPSALSRTDQVLMLDSGATSSSVPASVSLTFSFSRVRSEE